MLTVFTEVSLNPFFNLYKDVKKTIKWVVGKPNLPYSGHYAVVRSVIAGLNELNIDYNYNPRNVFKVKDHVHVLAGTNTLKMAIWLKRLKLIKRLTAGPNIVISSADHNDIIASKEIDFYTVNSEWTKEAYIMDNAKLDNRIGYWYAGVQSEFWKISKIKNQTNSLNFLIYSKRPNEKLLGSVKELIEDHGHKWSEFLYGSYTLDELKTKLSDTEIVIYFVEQESQGIAMFEIWATNTPTWHWDPEEWEYKNKVYKSSSAPYLTNITGRKFKNLSEFDELMNTQTNLEYYEPRKWILKYATDKLAISNFLNVIKYEYT